MSTLPSPTPLTINSTLPLQTDPLITIPILGFGIYQSTQSQCVQSCQTALSLGYRHIDSAQFYGNEAEMGEAVRRSGIPRRDVFLTTKIMSPGGSPEKTYRKCVESVRRVSGTGEGGGAKGNEAGKKEEGYVDLFLIHTASGGSAARKEMWVALERLLAEGKTRAIGVSNYGVGHIEEMKEYARVWPPHVNQLEVSKLSSLLFSLVSSTVLSLFFPFPPLPLLLRLFINLPNLQLHPWCQQRTITAYCVRNNIVIQAYSPLVRNRKSSSPALVSVAQSHIRSSTSSPSSNKPTTPTQVLIRYSLQKGWIPLPKSDNPQRIEENSDVFGWELSAEEMRTLDELDQGDRGAIVQAVRNG